MSDVPKERMPLHTTTVRFDAELWFRIVTLAAWMGISMAELVRAGAREYVVRIETLVLAETADWMSSPGRTRLAEQ
jgi:hypothetical protein